MLKSKNEFASFLTNIFLDIARNKNECREIASKVNKKYKVPIDIVTDIITVRLNAEFVSDFVLFCILDVIKPFYLDTYFTKQEIEMYSQSKFESEDLKFPLRFKMIQISPEQWIGKISVKELMKFRDAHMINYNENAQRAMRKIIHNGEEIFQIYINKGAVKDIINLYNSDTFIPNTITLNLHPESVYTYNSDTSELIIKEIKYFDILDGYHRYIALSTIYNINQQFDYDMELRIVNFSSEKAQQYIWQEDQKTKMRKIDSEALNQNNLGTRVVSTLNIDSTFSMVGKVARNNYLINSSELIDILNATMLHNISKKDENIKVQSTIQTLKHKMNTLISNDISLLQKKWDKSMILAFVFICWLNIDDNIISKKFDDLTSYFFSQKIVVNNRRMITIKRKLME